MDANCDGNLRDNISIDLIKSDSFNGYVWSRIQLKCPFQIYYLNARIFFCSFSSASNANSNQIEEPWSGFLVWNLILMGGGILHKNMK